MKRYIKLFEEFEEQEVPETAKDKTPKSKTSKGEAPQPGDSKWVGELPFINDSVLKWKELTLKIEKAKKDLEDFKASLGLSDMESEAKQLVEDMKTAMELISLKSHEIHGMALKYRAGSERFDPPSETMILGLLITGYEEIAKLVEDIKADTAYKTKVPVKASLTIKPDPKAVRESEEIEPRKPWYKRIGDAMMNKLRSMRSYLVKKSLRISEIADELEAAFKTHDSYGN